MTDRDWGTYRYFPSAELEYQEDVDDDGYTIARVLFYGRVVAGPSHDTGRMLREYYYQVVKNREND
jgi:hypothetical protein